MNIEVVIFIEMSVRWFVTPESIKVIIYMHKSFLQYWK